MSVDGSEHLVELIYIYIHVGHEVGSFNLNIGLHACNVFIKPVYCISFKL